MDNNNELPILGHGANPSVIDLGAIHAHQILDMAPVLSDIIDKRSAFPFPNVNQSTVGICTQADLIRIAQAHFGKIFSMRFGYVGQKKAYDGDMVEGSSNLSALKFGRNFGFLPIEFDPEGNDTSKPYSEFVNVEYTPEQYAEAKKYAGLTYALAPLDPVGFATAMNASKYGLMTRMSVGDNFYRPSWNKSDLELLRAPNSVTGGHSVGVWWLKGLDEDQIREMNNSWGGIGNPTLKDGTIWCGDGNLKYDYKTQLPYVTEAYLVTFDDVVFKHKFISIISDGQRSPEVSALQRVLVQLGFLKMPAGVAYGYYGLLTKTAVLAFQIAKNIVPNNGGQSVGPRTMAALNVAQGL